ncbi:ferrous iron transporter B [Pseudomonas sp. WN033]|nr:ferrous iron transporter B [Pseudomonas sp. WN033]
MLTGATSLDLVRDELFATIGDVEDVLQQFLEDRRNGSLLQRAIEGMQQVRGTLSLIELRGGSLLVAEMVALATDIPVHDGEGRNEPLTALCDSLFLLGRYLHLSRQQGAERPELLLPAINRLRALQAGQAPLPDSYFYQLPADLPLTAAGSSTALGAKTFARLRQMYQVGLLGLLRDDGLATAAPLMQRALQRWETSLSPAGASLCQAASAALEGIEQTPLALTTERKRLFARLDREVRRLGKAVDAPATASPLLPEFLYLIALSADTSSRCQNLRQALSLPAPGFTDAELEQGRQRLNGPGADVMRSVAEALHEEVTGIKDLLDLLARNAGDAEQSLESLKAGLERLWKTLSMLDLAEVSDGIRQAVSLLEGWQPGKTQELEQVADAVLQAETAVNRLDNPSEAGLLGGQGGLPEPVELKEARIVLIEESQAGLALAKRAITAYTESSNDAMHLLNVPSTLDTVRGGLVFLGMSRAAKVIHLASRFIKESMLERQQVPQASQLEILADALTSIEFYLESAERSSVTTSDVLALAEDSLAELGYKISEV